MGINIVKGQDKELLLRLTDKGTGDPFDFNGVELIAACFKLAAEPNLHKLRLPIIGDTASSSDLISNIADTSEILEGQPISGAGIPVGATVLKTPASTETPTSAGVIQISANATATASAVSLMVGNIEIVGDELLGKIKIPLNEDETDVLVDGNFEVRIVKGGVTSYVIFNNKLTIVSRIC